MKNRYAIVSQFLNLNYVMNIIYIKNKSMKKVHFILE